jgi:hypothetical protein
MRRGDDDTNDAALSTWQTVSGKRKMHGTQCTAKDSFERSLVDDVLERWW